MAQKTTTDEWAKVWESDKLRGDASFEDYFTSISRHRTATANTAYDLWVSDQHNINYSFAGYLDALVPTASHLSVLAPVWKSDSKTTFCLPDYMIRVVSADGFSNIPSLLPRWWSAAGTWSGDLPSWLQAGAPTQGSRPPKPPESARRERIAPPRAKPQEPSNPTLPPPPPKPQEPASAASMFGGGSGFDFRQFANWDSSTPKAPKTPEPPRAPKPSPVANSGGNSWSSGINVSGGTKTLLTLGLIAAAIVGAVYYFFFSGSDYDLSRKQLEAELSSSHTTAKCSGGLKAELGATQKCVLRDDDGDETLMTVIVRRLDKNGKPSIGWG